jgi:hypothetical protein
LVPLLLPPLLPLRLVLRLLPLLLLAALQVPVVLAPPRPAVLLLPKRCGSSAARYRSLPMVMLLTDVPSRDMVEHFFLVTNYVIGFVL